MLRQFTVLKDEDQAYFHLAVVHVHTCNFYIEIWEFVPFTASCKM